MPHLIALILLATGAFILARVLRSESERVNSDLERQRGLGEGGLRPVPLEKDPRSGVYRPRTDER